MRKKFASLLILTLLFAIQASAQTVDEIISKNIEARGGMEKLKSLKSAKYSGKMTLQQGIEAPITLIQKRPDKVRSEFTLQGMTGIQAYDGATAWMVMPFAGTKDPQKMPPDDARDIIEQADIEGPLVNYKEKGHTVELAGSEDVEGTPTHKLKVTLKNGQVRYFFIDQENHIELKISAIIKREGAEQQVDTYLGNYQTVEGFVVPFSIENRLKDQTITQIALEKAEFNMDVDDSIFKMPEESPQSAPAQQ